MLLLALSTGSSEIAPRDLFHALLHPDDSVASEVIHRLRLPRALAAFATGGLLALAGALMQVLLRNPLADPYVLGVSGGAAAGALGAMMLGLGSLAVHGGAFGGALLSISVVFVLASRSIGRLQGADVVDASPRLLLTGVIMAAGWSAIVTLLLSLAPDARLRGMLFWLMGDVGTTDTFVPALLALAVGTGLVYPVSRELNLLLAGSDTAQALGVHVTALRRLVYVVASLATAIAVTTAGSIGFVGLVVPHALRLVVGNDQRVLVPACALAGGALLVLSDTVARTVIAPQQLPLGVVTALFGVPVFLFLLLRDGAGAGQRAAR